MERPHGAKMEDWQLGGWASPDGSVGGLVVHEALQQSVNRYALPLRFLPDSRFGLWRDVEAHPNSSLLGIPVYLTPLSQLCHGYLPGVSPSRGWYMRAQLCGLCSFRLHATPGFALRLPRISPAVFDILQWWTDAGQFHRSK